MGDSPTDPTDDFEDGTAAEEDTHPPAASAEGIDEICACVEAEADAEENACGERWLVAIA